MKLNKAFLSALLAACLLLTLLSPAALAIGEELGLTDISLQGYFRNLVFEDGVIAARNAEGLWGLLNEKGETVLPFAYSDLNIIAHGLFTAGKDDHYSVIDKTGKVLVELGSSGWVRWWDGGFSAWLDDDPHFFDWEGNEVGFGTMAYGNPALDPYGEVYEAAEGLYSFSGQYTNESGATRYGRGIVDENGKVLVPPQSYVDVISDGEQVAIITKQQMLDRTGAVIPGTEEYDSFEVDYRDPTVVKAKAGDAVAALDPTGKVLVPLGPWSEIGQKNPDGYISAASYTRGSDGVLTEASSVLYRNGAPVAEWEGWLVSTQADMAPLAYQPAGEKGYGLMDPEGNSLVEPRYSSFWVDKAGNIQAEKNWTIMAGSNGLFTQAGEPVLPIDFQDVSLDGERYVITTADGLYGLYSTEGEEILPPRYEYLAYDVACYEASDDEGCWLLDRDGNVILGPWPGLIRWNFIPMTGYEEYERRVGHARYLPFLLYEAGPDSPVVKTVQVDMETGKLAYEMPGMVAYAVNAEGWYAYKVGEEQFAFARVEQEPALPDLTEDGKTDAADAMALFRSVSAPEGAEPPAALDLNEDNRVNTRDALLFSRLLAVREDK